MNPQLLIIGGPNGAGKSTFSKNLSSEGALIFDVDIVIAKHRLKSPGWPPDSIIDAVQREFLDTVDEALSNRLDLTIETNLRDWVLKDTVARFRDAGYEVGLVFMCLPSVEHSMNRVTQRVNHGGHFVDKNSIRYNFDEGLKNLKFLAERFDHIEILDASNISGKLTSLLSVKQKKLIYRHETPPEWISDVIKIVAGRFSSNEHNVKNTEERRRGLRR